MHAISDTGALRHDHRLVFLLQLALGVCGLIAAGAAVADAAGSVHHDARAPHEVVVLGGHFSYPAVNVAAVVLLVLAALGLIVILSAVIAGLRQLRAYRHFLAHIPVLGTLPSHPYVSVIADETPQAFCAGYLRPRIYISAGAVNLLAPEELSAVLLHEQHHRSARDPLRLACARILSQALFFLPALSPLGERYVELAELRADDAAVRGAAGNKRALASALLAFDERAPNGSAGISPERVDSLLGVRTDPRLPIAPIVASLVALAIAIVVVWRASAVASADATLNLPLVSSQPCMLVLALVPALACLGGIAGRRVLRPARLT